MYMQIYRFEEREREKKNEKKVFLLFFSQKSSGTAGIRWRSIT
jgi:hypothetical protein